jgi:diguanylate cyclase
MLAALALAAVCSAPADIAVPQDILALDDAIQVLRETDEPRDLAAVTRSPDCHRFVPAAGVTPSFAGAGSAWLRFRADLSSAPLQQWRLSLRAVGLNEVCVHWPLRDGRVATDCALRESAPQRWASGRLLFQVPADHAPLGLVHVHARSSYWLRLPLELGTTDALLARDPTAEFDWGLYYGLLLAIAAFGLMFFFGARDAIHIYFALHIAVLAVGLMTWHGQLTRFDPSGWTVTRMLFALVGLFVASGSGFYQRFLETRQHAPTVHHLLNGCQWLGALLAVLIWIWPEPTTGGVSALALAWVLVVLWVSAVRLRQRYQPAALVFAAVLSLLAGIFLSTSSGLGLSLLDPHLSLQLMQVGALTTATLLTAGMVLRVRQLIRERDQASELALANQKLALHRISHDEVTGLPKRSKFREDLQARLVEAQRCGHQLALVTLSPDNFRALGHALGQDESDAALTETTLRLREVLAPGEMLGSVGSSNFIWLTRQGKPDGDHTELRTRCNALRATLAAPLTRARGASLSFSMGAALYPQHGNSAEVLLRDSDEALYRAQQSGTAIEIFQPAQGGHGERNLELSKDLQQAILRDELELHYQPIVPFNDATGLFSAEALMRWNHKGEMIPPDRFVRLAEASGLILPLSDYVLRGACRQLAEWRRRRQPVLSVSVNISAQEFRLPGFTERVERALAYSAAPASGLVLELTEGVLVEDLAAAAKILARLAELGVKVAVDDFGVGYSSLSYLRNLPVNSIKIDRSFLQGIPDEAEAISVIGAIITMGRDLGLKLTAEGIETEAQMHFLARRGVHAGQGWLFAKAMPATAFEAWLLQRRSLGFAA